MTTPPADDPLDLALVQFRHAVAIADMHDGSPDADVRAIIERWGAVQHQAAEMAAQFALVSIAQSLHNIADHGCAAQQLDAQLDRLDRALDRAEQLGGDT